MDVILTIMVSVGSECLILIMASLASLPHIGLRQEYIEET